MFCSHCGKEVTVGAKFCSNCGAAIGSQPIPEKEQPQAPAVERTVSPGGSGTENGGQPGTDAKKKGVPKPLIIVAAALVLVIGFGAVLSLFGGGSEPDSGSMAVSDAGVADWVDKIPVDATLNIDGFLIYSESTVLSNGLYTKISYGDYKKSMGSSFVATGMTNYEGISYYEHNNTVLGFHNKACTYFITREKSESVSSAMGSAVPVQEPLIAKLPTAVEGIGEVYCLFFEGEGGYMIWATTTQNPASSYMTWEPIFVIAVSDKDYCSFLNGEQELEIISAPGERESSGANPEMASPPAETTPLGEWIDKIPVASGYADLIYLESSSVQAHLRPQIFKPGGILDFLGLSNSEQVSYETAILGSGDTVCIGYGPDRVVSYAEVMEESMGAVGNYYQVVQDVEPLIGMRDDGYCFLLYRRDYDTWDGNPYCYEMYLVQPTDSPNYEDWAFNAYIYVNDPQYCDYLNGEKGLQILSYPSGNPGNDSNLRTWVDKIPEIQEVPSGKNNGFNIVEDINNHMSYEIRIAKADVYYWLTNEEMFIIDESAPVYFSDVEFRIPNRLILEARDINVIRGNSPCYGFRKSDYQVVYYHEAVGTDALPSVTLAFPLPEPLIVKTEQDIYLLCYKYHGTYMVIVTVPDDLSITYEAWKTITRIYVTDIKYCSYLNGTIPVEVVSIPDESGQ